MCILVSAIAAPSAQSDLDAFMSRVVARRDDNWTKLQQYVLNERETFQLIGPAATPLFGLRNEYVWFPRDGTFIRSPVTANGVTLGESDRRTAERRWLQREARRERRAQESRPHTESSAAGDAGQLETAMRDALEPGFVSSAYFLKFTFEQGRYALVGREPFDGREALRIEYYPTLMFKEGRTRPNKALRKRDDEIERKMNKVALVTLWVIPEEHQIVKYEFKNMDMDFLPGSWLVRPEGWHAAMEMGQPFEDVWLPRSIQIGFDVTSALGPVNGQYEAEYYDYRLASVTSRVR
jgi:hypothetical protein